MNKDSPLTQEYLKSILEYNPISGEFKWKKNGLKAGYIQENKNNYKRIIININRKVYKAHRLAFLYTYGFFPKNSIDHINGNPLDNRISNLRQATNQQNGFNQKKRNSNKFGLKGVYLNKQKKFCACIKINYKTKYLGIFNTALEAHNAYCKAAKELFGEFARYD